MRQRMVNRAWCGAAILIVACSALAQGPVSQVARPIRPPNETRGLGAAKPASKSVAGNDGTSITPGSGAGFVRTALSLGGVLGLALIGIAATRVVSRRGGVGLASSSRSPAGVMEILGRYPIGRGATLVLLKLDRRVLLLSQSVGGKLGLTSGVTTLCEVTDPDEIASILLKARDAEGDSLAERFRGLLSRFDRNMDVAAPEEPTPRRTVSGNAAGDRAELWRETAEPIQIVDLTRRPREAEPTTAVGTLRRRLAAFRGPSSEGGRP